MAEEKQKESEIQEFEIHKPIERGCWEGFTRALHNPDTNEYLGRTVKSWVLITIFYIFFYLGLAALFAGCMSVFYMTIDYRFPKRQQLDSLIGDNPGLGLRPISGYETDDNYIYFNGKNESQGNTWIRKLNEFMKPYITPVPGKNAIECSFYRRPIGNEICKIDTRIFGPCSPKDLYGYRTSSPCIFLKLNKIFGWEPDTYLLPHEDMPQKLKDHIVSLPQLNRTQVWVSCNGLTAHDDDLIEGFNYYPWGIPSYFFPYRNGDNYLSPLVAVQLVYPRANNLIGIECRAWAKNIRYHGGSNERTGSIQFYFHRDYFNVPID